MPYYAWKEQREKNAYLALADGTVFRGYSVGAPLDRLGEVVFNTGMTGYQEILSDPSYAGQFVCLTAPEIGNTGVNKDDMESRSFFASALLVHKLNQPSNWRSDEPLDSALARTGTPALAGIETRALTRLLRDKGSQNAFLCASGVVPEREGVERARSWEGLVGMDYASMVSCDSAYAWDTDNHHAATFPYQDTILPPVDFRVVAYDFGIKWNILRNLRRVGIATEVVPAHASAEAVAAMEPDGVFLSNGPADPAALGFAVAEIKKLLGRFPVMGICLGHQLLAIAKGAKTYKLSFGHHGCNHPVKDLRSDRTFITSQNHNFAVDADSLAGLPVDITHLSLNDGSLEGFHCLDVPAFAVQFHPEAAPGPFDALGLFGEFRTLLEKNQKR